MHAQTCSCQHPSSFADRTASGNPETPWGGEGRSRGSSKMPPLVPTIARPVWGETAAKSKQDGPLRKPSSVDVSTGSQNEPRGSANLVVTVRIMAGAGVGRSHDSVSRELTPSGERAAAGGCRRGVRARKSDGG